MDTVQLIGSASSSSSSSSSSFAVRPNAEGAEGAQGAQLSTDDDDPEDGALRGKFGELGNGHRTACGGRLTRRELTTLLIMLVTACLFADQNLMAPNLTEIRLEFNMTKEEGDRKLGGQIALALFLVGGPASLLVGYLADRINRRKLYCAVVLLGELGCLLTVFVTDFWHLFLLRAMTGIALGGALPLVFSMLGDMWEAKERVKVSAVVGIGWSLGTLLGQLMAGVVGPAWGWRVPFVIVAMPSCVLALVFLRVASDPARASMDGDGGGGESGDGGGEPYTEEITWPKVKSICASQSNRLMFAQGIPGCMPWGMVSVFLNDFLHADNGAPTILAATTVCTFYGIGGLFGQGLGGWLGQRLYNKRKVYVAWLMGGSTMIGVFPMLLLLNLPFSYGALIPVAFIGGLCASITGPNVRAVLQNCNLPETRGTVFAMFALTDDLGKAFGPFLIAGFVTAIGRRAAFNLATCAWFLCGLLLLGLSRTMLKDEQTVSDKVAQARRGRGGVELGNL